MDGPGGGRKPSTAGDPLLPSKGGSVDTTQKQTSLIDPSALVPNDRLTTISESEFRERTAEVLSQARMGHQIAIADQTGKIVSIMGMNGVRVLPLPPLDPIFAVEFDEPNTKQNRSEPWTK